MRTFCVGVAAGALVLAWPWPTRPWTTALAAVGLACVVSLAVLWRVHPGIRLRNPAALPASPPFRVETLLSGVGGFALAVLWSAAIHERALADRLPDPGTGDALPIVVRVAGDPVPLRGAADGAPAVRFPAEILEGRGRATQWVGRIVRLSWYGAEPVRPGEVWRLAATLRPPVGHANPGGFDFERWLLGQGIDGLGSVRRGARVADPGSDLFARLRIGLVGYVRSLQLQFGSVLIAQLVGVGVDIPPEQWAVFRASGTVHLMVISGSHVALAAGFGYAIGRSAARLLPFLLAGLGAPAVGAWFGAGCSLFYLGLSGGGLPVLRAVLMAAPALLLAASGRRCQPGAALTAALAGVLLIDPLAVHQQGFWLSFGAVAVLVWRYARQYDRRAGWRVLLEAQWLLSLALAPLLVVTTGSFPPSGVLANLVAVPVISFVIVPLALLGGVLVPLAPSAAELTFRLADRCFDPLYRYLEACAAFAPIHAEPEAGLAWIALAGAAAWVLGLPARRQILVLLAVGCAFLPRSLEVTPGGYRVTALDVGQGDAILVDTARHRLLFDAGPLLPGGFDAGAAVVVPSLLATGPGRLDAMVLSHEDLDHLGGADAVAGAVPVAQVFASFPRAGSEPCSAAAWRWDGVEFRFLQVARPPADRGTSPSNNRSCVLLVDDGLRRTLLAGDIGAAVERALLAALPHQIDLLLAPHHGSATSSSAAFLRSIRPRVVFVSAGRNNRYGHPHADVLQRYRAVGARVLQTAHGGALVWNSRAPQAPLAWRLHRRPYWRS